MALTVAAMKKIDAAWRNVSWRMRNLENWTFPYCSNSAFLNSASRCDLSREFDQLAPKDE
jgi:hypothetical protein